jgi:uncharacterized RDD family membrane protein YckC
MQQQPEHHHITEVAQDTFVDETGHQLTKQEVRQIVTPHAFVIAEELVGQPLARPLRRAVAMGIDGLIISGLASASLVFVLPAMLYLCWNRLKAKKRNHLLLMVLATLSMLATLNWAPELVTEKEKPARTGTQLSPQMAASLGKISLELSTKDCEEPCVESKIQQLATELQQSGVSIEQQKELLSGVLELTDLKSSKKRLLRDKYLAEPVAVAQSADEKKPGPAQAKDTEQHSILTKLARSDYSLIKMIKGILADFGLGFGWAMFYFTFFTSWNQGRTVGKMLTKTRVVRLDNKPLSLWVSFSRQGGYGAGLATGLVGFAQILWDPNRQAIQDKVASTVVIYQP